MCGTRGSHTRRLHTPHTSTGTSFARVRTSLFYALMTRSISTSRPSRTRIPRTVIRSTVAWYVFRNLNYLIFFYKRSIKILLCITLRMQIDLINYTEVETTSQITLLERGVRVPESRYKDTLCKIQDNLTRALRALTCRGRDDVGASSSSHASAHVYTVGPSTSAAPHAASSGTVASSSCKSFIIAISITFDLHD
jgi:hypothetical protein